VDAIVAHYRHGRVGSLFDLTDYQNKHSEVFKQDGLGRSLEALRQVLKVKPHIAPGEIPDAIQEHFHIKRLWGLVLAALREDIKCRIVFVYDGLDEGWVPNAVATGLLGGLAKLAAEFSEADAMIHCLLFIRDNMFRALAQFDSDYSRNIEGNTLRLHWDETSLLNLVALRLRSSFDWKGENDIKAWGRFAKRGLEGLDGFRKCLRFTLYRPRDVIGLLNNAYQIAASADRQEIIDTDIEVAATRISRTRLADLYKEYADVLPGLKRFAEAFRGRAAQIDYNQVLLMLQETMESEVSGAEARDFALLRTGEEAFAALYSVGFIGVQEAEGVRFCHDGSNIDVSALAATRKVVVHPCYWRGLDLKEDDTTEVVIRVDDEDDITATGSAKEAVADMRLRKLGTIIGELGMIPEGPRGAVAFEKWVFDAVRYLFAKGLTNIQWRPNPAQVQQRDIVGTVEEYKFWKRVTKYDVSQFIIEVKNFSEIGPDEFRQAWGYLNGPYGRCLMMVTRAEEDSIATEHERALVKEGYDQDVHKMVILMPARLLARALRKMQRKNEDRDDYIDGVLMKRLDIFERDLIHQKTPRVKRK
jgi:hypothetical protein